jgi:hypothetical protein
MLVSNLRVLVVSTSLLACGPALQAQQTGGGGFGTGTGGTGTGSTGTGGQTGGTGGGTTIGTPTASGAGGALDADVAFSAVERGATVGATGGTGTGFSELSVANQGAGGLGGLGGFRGLGGGGLGGLGGLSSLFGGMGQEQIARPAVRTRLRSAVLYEPRPPEVVERRVSQQFRSLTQPQLRGVTITMEGRRGVVTGVVESERHRRMSELLLRLEPGINEIDNQIQVASP